VGDEPGEPRSRGVGRPVVFGVVAYSFLVTMLGTTMPTPLYPLYQAKMGFSGFVVTLVFATYAAGVIAALLLCGGLSDRIGRRPVLLPGVLLSASSAVVFLFAGGVGALLVGRVLSGLSAGVFTGTATATLLDLVPTYQRARAGMVAAAVNMGGLGLGPPLAGILAQYAPAPLHLCFVVDLALLVPAAIGIWLIPEPIVTRGRVRLRPQRLRVPAEVRGTFVRAAIAGFAGFAVLGLFTAVSPSFLGQVLHEPNHALVGLVVFSLFLASTVGQVLARYVSEHRALLIGCLTLAAGVAIVGVSLWQARLELLVLGAVVAGLGQGSSFRAGLVAVGSASPPEHRGEVSSSLFVVIYVAISLPVIGVGAASETFGLVPAGIVFAAAVAVLALIGFVSLLRRR
jgi:MFS family permease